MTRESTPKKNFGRTFKFPIDDLNIIAPNAGTNTSNLETALDSCLETLFGVSLTSFTPSQRGKNGNVNVNFTDPNRRLNGLTGFGVLNNATSFSGDLLGRINAQVTNRASGTLAGLTVNGYGFSPHINYTANDRERFQSGTNPELQALIGGYRSTQIHELGNSIAYITGRDIGDPRSRIDTDSGFQLANCVTRGLQGR